jgi:hypothetical protein
VKYTGFQPAHFGGFCKHRGRRAKSADRGNPGASGAIRLSGSEPGQTPVVAATNDAVVLGWFETATGEGSFYPNAYRGIDLSYGEMKNDSRCRLLRRMHSLTGQKSDKGHELCDLSDLKNRATYGTGIPWCESPVT